MASLATKAVYLYVYLPCLSEPVLAGKMTSIEDHQGRKKALFRYAESYLHRSDRKAIDPINLPFAGDPSQIYETTTGDEQEAFSVMYDSIPDAWGRSRMLRGAGRDQMTALEFILASGEDRSGFLAYGLGKHGPEIIAPWAIEHPKADLLDVSSVALLIDEDHHITLRKEDAQKILLYGSTLGGARPKVTVLYEDRVWLAKPSKEGDPFNFPRAEFAVLSLAKVCGLHVPAVKVVTINGNDVYLIERFDRAIHGGRVERSGFLSMYAAIGYPKKIMRAGSYTVMASKIDQASADPQTDKRELFGRLIFNALVGNDDDHLRNHAFYEDQGRWRLSPLFDVIPAPFKPIPQRRLNQTFGSEGSLCTVANILSSCEAFGLPGTEAYRVVHHIVTAFVEHWPQAFHEAGVPEDDMEGFRATFAIADSFKAELD